MYVVGFAETVVEILKVNIDVASIRLNQGVGLVGLGGFVSLFLMGLGFFVWFYLEWWFGVFCLVYIFK